MWHLDDALFCHMLQFMDYSEMGEKLRSGDDVVNLTSWSEAPRSELNPSPKGDSRTRGSLQSISQGSLPKLPTQTRPP